MNTFKLVLFGLMAFVAVEAKYELSQTAKDCIKETGTDEDTIRTLILTETGKTDETNEIVKKFIGCCYRDFISDTNELVVDEKFTKFITAIFTKQTDGRSKLAILLTEDCIKHCEGEKGDTKDETAVKVSNCLMTRLHHYIKQD